MARRLLSPIPARSGSAPPDRHTASFGAAAAFRPAAAFGPAAPFRPAAPFDLAAYRRQRFAGGIQCPRCDGRSVHRWGRFGDRRRYRCLGCQRTFSDLTGTPLAYLKRLERWPSFCDGVLASQPVRPTAEAVGVHASTVFRWRHRLLQALHIADVEGLHGDVAVSETCFPFSEKGRRDLERAPRRRGDPFWWLGERAWVLLARDESGRALAANTGFARPRVQEMARVLMPRFDSDVRILDAAGPLGAAASLARREGLGYHRLRGRALLDHPAACYGLQLRRWLATFRGVATKYLSSYLAWHRFLALSERRSVNRSEARTLLMACSFP